MEERLISAVPDGKTGMKSKARILLISLVVTCAASISVAFHNCYVIDALHPELPENTPPIIDYTTVSIDDSQTAYGAYIIPYDELKMVEFKIGEIWDPDKEARLYGKYAIDYDGSSVISGGTNVIFTRISDELWSASIKFPMEGILDTGCHEVITAVSDRDWVVCPDCEPFSVPEETRAAFATWLIWSCFGDCSEQGCISN